MNSKIQILIQSYDGKTIVESFSKSTKIYEILDSLKIRNVSKESIYLTFNSKILKKSNTLQQYNIENNDILFLNSRIKGGVFPIIIAVLILIMTFMITFLILLEDLIVIFVKLIEIIPLIFDPKRFINDIIFGITFAIRSTFGGMFSSVDSGTSMRDAAADEAQGKIPKVCVPPTLMNLIFLVICPPLALFLDRGLLGLFHVIVCSILTVKLYYFPGFIFAALHILC
jgi:uncharacterized membrane protein YqaE (UPF0057 family)